MTLRFALRSFAKRPAVSLLAILSLAVAMGLNTAAFSILDAYIFRELPVKDPARLAWMLVRDRQDRVNTLNWLEFDRLRTRGRTIEGAIAQSRQSPKVRLADRVDYPITAGVSENFFDLLGVRAGRGDVFHSGTDVSHSATDLENTLVISDRYWRNTLGADPAIVGRMLNVGDSDLRIIGVTPPGFYGTNRGVAVDLFVPPPTYFRTLRMARQDDVKNNDFEVLARLRPGVSTEHAQREFETLMRQAEADGLCDAPGRKALVDSFTAASAIAKLRTNGVFPAMMTLILLIAAMNIAALRLVDNEARRRDTGMRVALGAGRAALAREHVAETAIVAVSGAVLGTMLALWLVDLAPAFLSGGQKYVEYSVRMDWRTWAFSGTALVAVALIGSLIPLSEAWRFGVVPLLQTRTTRRQSRWLSGLVIGQIAFVTACACSAAVLWRSLDKLAEIRPAMDPDRKTLLARAHWESKTDYAVSAELIAQRLAGIPGVQSVAYARRAMLSGSGGGAQMDVEVPGKGLFAYRYNTISPLYVQTTGARVAQGRAFEPGDGKDATQVVMVNETFSRRFFPGGDAVGSWIRVGDRQRQIVGIMEDGPSIHLKEQPQPYFYLPFAQQPVSYLTYFIASKKDPETLVSAVRSAFREADRAITLTSTLTLREHMNSARSDERLAAGIAGVLSGVGLLLAAAGLFGVTYHSVRRRVRELGIRLALGASGGTLRSQILMEASKKVAIAIPLGWVMAFSARRIIEKYLYGVRPADPWMFGMGAAIVGLVACAAAMYPAIRASRVDPAQALRDE